MYGVDEVQILKTSNSVASIIRDTESDYVPDDVSRIENRVLGTVDAGIISQLDDDVIIKEGSIVADPQEVIDSIEFMNDLIEDGHLKGVNKRE